MGRRVLVLIGTKKGAFILDGDEGRQSFSLRGPFCETWPINHVIADPATGAIHAGGGNPWFGPAVWTSEDRGETWRHDSTGLTYGEGEDAVASVWSIAPAHGRLWVGVEPAGLFASDDGGRTFTHVGGLRDHPSRPHWNPGAGGLILHHLVPHPQDPDQLWVAISAAGVFWTHDGGKSFEARNRGTRADFNPEDQRYPEWGQCVHSLRMAPGNPNRLYQQNHCGMYRSDDGGQSWQSIEEGLPSTFGFPVAVHPRDPDQVFFLPLNGADQGRFVPEGRAAVWRSRDCGSTWADLRNGLPQKDAYFGVLRQAMATDTMEPAGVYFGTSSGSLWASDDEGESFREIARDLPPIASVETVVLEA
jgi:photosystem II stability/assembly factor-like uncharacterized protein